MEESSTAKIFPLHIVKCVRLCEGKFFDLPEKQAYLIFPFFFASMPSMSQAGNKG